MASRCFPIFLAWRRVNKGYLENCKVVEIRGGKANLLFSKAEKAEKKSKFAFFPKLFPVISLCFTVLNSSKLIIHQQRAVPSLDNTDLDFLLPAAAAWDINPPLGGVGETLKSQFLSPLGSPPLLQSPGPAGQSWAGPGGQRESPGALQEKPWGAQGTHPAARKTKEEPARNPR